MSDWPTKKLGDLLTLEYGEALGAETRSGKGFPVYGSNGVVGFHSKSLVTGPGIVVGRKGSAGKVTWTDRDFWPIDTTYWVSSSESADLRFLREVLNQAGLQRLNSATGVPGLNRQDAYPIQVRVPPLKEQRRIAEILDTIDESIKATERVIAKLNALRLSILERTIWAGTGDVRLLSEIAEGKRGMTIGPFGSDLVATDYRTEGVPVYFVRDVASGGFVRHNEEIFVSEEKAQQLGAHQTRPGDVLITKMGLPPGVAALHDHMSTVGIITADLIRLRSNTQTVRPEWLVEALGGPQVQRQLDAITAGVTRPKITLRDYRSIQLQVPKLEKQDTDLRVLNSVMSLKRTEAEQLEKLRTSRNGLAADLLSGRVKTVAP